jgi:hypothetical protein
VKTPRIDDRDWTALTTGERIRQIEVEGYVVLPDLLSTENLTRLKQETAKLEPFAVDYSVHQLGQPGVQFMGGAMTELIGHPETLSFLRILFGEEIIFMTSDYARSEPGHPGVSLHTDGQPYGSEIFGHEGSCPCVVRVLYYLDDLTPEVSPFRVIPHSHLALHADANPYKRYESHPEEVMVTLKAGSAVVFQHHVFHGNFPNTGTRSREMLALSYRPAWAGPAKEISAFDPAEIERLPDAIRPLFADRNTRHWNFSGGNKPPDMASEAPGINPSRWHRT